MDTDDDDLPYEFSKDAPPDREGKPKSRLLIWPWLVAVGLAAVGLTAIAAGVIGPMVR